MTVFALTQNPIASVCSMLGSTFPDRIEVFMKHRTWSHWFVLYLPSLLFYREDTVYLFWFFAGAMFHIIEDAICGKIPLYSPYKRIWVFPRLFYTGSKIEYVFVFLYSLVMLLIIFVFKKGVVL